MNGQRLRSTLRHHPAGVVVVTAAGVDRPAGCTVSSFAGASLVPPLVSLCLKQSSRTFAAIVRTGRFAVHLLAAQQRDLAARFADPAADRFAPHVAWQPDEEGVPRLHTGAARLRCALRKTVEVGDQVLIVAEVLRIDPGEKPAPLVYVDGRYGVPTPL